MGQSCWNIYSVGSVSHLSSSALNLFFLHVVTTPNQRGKAKLLTVFTSDSESSSVVKSPTLCDSVEFSRPEHWSGRAAFPFLQGIVPTQGLNPGLMHCRQILYHLSQEAKPRILEWAAYPFSTASSWPRNLCLLHCRWILYQLSYQGSGRIC